MKFTIVGLCAIVLAAAVIALSQEPPPQSPQPQPPPMAQHPPQGPPPPGQPPMMPQHAPRPPEPPQPPDPIAQNLFPPEMVMHHREDIGLTDEQSNAIKQELRKASARFNELQWQIQDDMEAMDKLTREANVDEQKVLAQLDKILNAEREMKRTQLAITIRIKNKLTPDQQAKLRELQKNMHQPPR